jgi:hypothetical protein
MSDENMFLKISKPTKNIVVLSIRGFLAPILSVEGLKTKDYENKVEIKSSKPIL